MDKNLATTAAPTSYRQVGDSSPERSVTLPVWDVCTPRELSSRLGFRREWHKEQTFRFI